MSKQAAQNFDVERMNLRKINELEVGKQCWNKVSNSFAALENLYNSKDINKDWENITENIKTSAKVSLGL